MDGPKRQDRRPDGQGERYDREVLPMGPLRQGCRCAICRDGETVRDSESRTAADVLRELERTLARRYA